MQGPDKKYHWKDLKDQLESHSPDDSLWDNISEGLDRLDEGVSFDDNKDSLPSYSPSDNIWDGISEALDSPAPVFDWDKTKDRLTDHSPAPALWENIESQLELDAKIEALPEYQAPPKIWDQIEEELTEISSGLSFIRVAIMMGITLIMLVGAILYMQVDKEEASLVEPVMLAEAQPVEEKWSNDEDVNLIREMCKDYMAVCEMPEFKELESELVELNQYKEELLGLVSSYDEQQDYIPMLAKIEKEKTQLMKQMIAMI